MHHNRATPTRSFALLTALVLLLAACMGGAGGTGPLATPATTPAVIPSAAPTPGASPADVRLTEVDNGHTVTVAVGSTVTVVLASTYWQVQGSSDAAVLLLASGPVIAPAAQGTCVPGGGCGTVTTVFRALGPGRASVTAGRTTCGEAMQCTGTNGAFEVTIVVGE